MGRPRVYKDTRRPISINFPVDLADEARQRICDQLGISLSAYVVALVEDDLKRRRKQ